MYLHSIVQVRQVKQSELRMEKSCNVRFVTHSLHDLILQTQKIFLFCSSLNMIDQCSYYNHNVVLFLGKLFQLGNLFIIRHCWRRYLAHYDFRGKTGASLLMQKQGLNNEQKSLILSTTNTTVHVCTLYGNSHGFNYVFFVLGGLPLRQIQMMS